MKTMNVNEIVRLKLNDSGRAILRDQHDELYAYLRSRGTDVDHPYTPRKEDDGGWSEWQLWDVMSTFGSHIGLGRTAPFETEIQIPDASMRDPASIPSSQASAE